VRYIPQRPPVTADSVRLMLAREGLLPADPAQAALAVARGMMQFRNQVLAGKQPVRPAGEEEAHRDCPCRAHATHLRLVEGPATGPRDGAQGGPQNTPAGRGG
jgi:hypothetical protein